MSIPRPSIPSTPTHLAHVLSALGLALALTCPGVAVAQTPLDPALIPKFAAPLPLPGALDGTTTSALSPLVITMSEFQQQILPASLYPPQYSAGTYVWGYNGTYPGPTIVARRGTPTHVRYVNDLANPAGGPLFLQSRITVDQTLHWADPLGTGHSGEPYLGPVPACVHLHGGEVPSSFDGGPDAWWTPGHAHQGPGYVTDQYVYPNEQQAMTMFYHDHALGMTRTNVYSGLAGFYLLRDPAGEPPNLPGGATDPPADQYGNPYEVGLAIQDRMFDTDGQLYFPATGINPEHPYWLPEFFGNVILVNGKPWPYMNVEPRRYRLRIVNGSNARFYRLALAGAGGPVPALWQIGTDGGLLDGPVRVGDLLDPGSLLLLMAPGERADLIIDFAGFAGGVFTLTNDANEPFPDGDPLDPYAREIMQFRVGSTVTGGSDASLDPASTPVLRYDLIERPPVPAVSRALTLNENMGVEGPLEMFVNNTMWAMTPTENLIIGDTEAWEIINLTADTHPMHLHLFQFQLLERQPFDVEGYMAAYGMPMAGMGPPMAYDDKTPATGFKRGGNPDVTPYLQGPAVAPDANENGWKDTFRMNPGEVSRILVRAAPQDAMARAAAMTPPVAVEAGINLFPFEPWTALGDVDGFGFPGGPGYVWHCHIIDHEDNEMMRPLMVLGPDTPTATLLARFEAVTTGEGVKVSWELRDPGFFAAVRLERGTLATGPWARVAGEPLQEGRVTSVVDRSVEAGRAYWYRLVGVVAGGGELTFGPIQGSSAAPLAFGLGVPSPTPAAGAVRVDFTVARESEVRLAVLDVQGREVARLAQGTQRAGHYVAVWDGAGPAGRAAAGIYFVSLQAGGRSFTRRLVLAR